MLMREIIEADEPKKTKTKGDELGGISNIDDLLADIPDHPVAKVSQKGGSGSPSAASGKADRVPDMPRASADKTARATANMTPTDAMRDMMSRMAVPDDDDLDDDDVVPEPVRPDNVPAVIRREIANTDPNAINPEWHVVANLPGNMQRAIRQLGKALFGAFTRTPTQDITMIGNVAGQGPNSSRDVRGVINWIGNNGRRVDTAGIDFDRTIPGYRADITQHTVGGVRFMVVRDQFGEYVYAWPESDSLDSQEGLPAPTQARLREAGGPWDPNRLGNAGGNVVKFPTGGKAPAAAVPGKSPVPEVPLPKVNPSEVKAFMKLPPVRKIIWTVVKKSLPAIGAYFYGSAMIDHAKEGRWRDVFLDMAGAGLDIAGLLGYIAGPAGVAAAFVANVAAALYTERENLMRLYFMKFHPEQNINQYSDEVLLAYADELTKIMAGYIYEEVKSGAGDAYNYVKSYMQGSSGQQPQQGQPAQP